MAKFVVVDPVEHDGAPYAAGDVIDIKVKAQSDILLSGGQIVTEAQAKAAAAAAEAEQPPA